jgi:tripartite-type tricarboxylate transporter receptor subunit TctC
LPPGTPAEIVQVYRDAFVKVAEDPDFLARAKGMAEDFTPTSWQDLQSWIKTMAETPPEAIAFLAVMLHHQGVKAE